ncbi:MAG: hypothetical protein AT715_03920 [Thermoproteus sp. JCHS_4]|nr:MAG: hypothetical protein AT715_03920 [Thermoproteus sp. JCHS_4]
MFKRILLAGSRGLSTMKRVLLGSVSTGIVTHAKRPVLIVKQRRGFYSKKRLLSCHISWAAHAHLTELRPTRRRGGGIRQKR